MVNFEFIFVCDSSYENHVFSAVCTEKHAFDIKRKINKDGYKVRIYKKLVNGKTQFYDTKLKKFVNRKPKKKM